MEQNLGREISRPPVEEPKLEEVNVLLHPRKPGMTGDGCASGWLVVVGALAAEAAFCKLAYDFLQLRVH